LSEDFKLTWEKYKIVQEEKKMKNFRICLVLLIGMMLMGGTALAWDNTSHVKAAANAKGDLIIFPWYYTANGGWETKLTVINTSPTASTVAKVVIKSEGLSQELLDFLIFLSPNDVWTGYLEYGTNGPYIYSTDDSMLRDLPPASGATDSDFASVANPVSQTLYPVSCTSVDSNAYGYAEVIESTSTTGLSTITGTTKVAKSTIYNWYAATYLNSNNPPAVTPMNILTGYQEFMNPTLAMFDALKRAEVFADWGNTTVLRSTTATGIGGLNLSRNTIGELEASMAKSNIALPYINSANGDFAIHLFTFPTKLSWQNSTCTNGVLSYIASTESPYFQAVGRTTRCETYTANGYDLSENTPSTPGSPFSGGTGGPLPTMCNELNLVSTLVGTTFTEGWIRYNWLNTPTAKTFVTQSGVPATNTYTGTPVLPLTLYFKSEAATQAAAAYDNGVVVEGGANLLYYQSSQSAVPTE